jgi:Skp family chaperone for outer membrane proteins
MHRTRILLTCGLLSLALIGQPAESEDVHVAARNSSGCVACHTDRDTLKSSLDTTKKNISALIEGPG